MRRLESYGDYPIEKYFGTNQYVIIESEEDVLESIKIIEITEKVYKQLNEIFELSDWRTFGTTVIL